MFQRFVLDASTAVTYDTLSVANGGALIVGADSSFTVIGDITVSGALSFGQDSVISVDEVALSGASTLALGGVSFALYRSRKERAALEQAFAGLVASGAN